GARGGAVECGRGRRSCNGARHPFRTVRGLEGDLLRHQPHPAQIHDEAAGPDRAQRASPAHGARARGAGAAAGRSAARRGPSQGQGGMTKHWTANGTHRVPYFVYTDPEIYADELRKVFGGRAWNFVGLEAEIPNGGDFKRTAIGETSVIVVRDREGKVHVLENQCAHRGLQVCRQDYGSTRAFQCPYHQWTYRLDGDLSGVPFMK